jgi:hypothetical protein
MTFLAAQYDSALGYTPQQDRLLIAAAISPGIVGPNDLLAYAASGFNSQIAGGSAAIPGTVQANAGSYFVTNLGPVNALHSNPDPTNSRLDTLFIKVFDSRDGGDASDIVQPVVVPGTPQAGNPSSATLFASRAGVGLVPSNAYQLADVYVPAAAPSAASFVYSDRRSTAVIGSSWTTYTPTWTTTGTQPTLGSGSLIGAYSRNGKTIAVRISLELALNTSGGTGVWNFLLPFMPEPDGANQVLGGYVDPNGTVYAAIGLITSGVQTVQPWAGSLQITSTQPQAWSAGSLALQGVYECI